MIDAIIQDRFTCVSKPATMRSPVLLRPVGQWIGAGSGSSDSFSPRPTAFQIGGDPSCESPQRGQKHRSEEHTSELQSLMRISYAVFCLKKKKQRNRKK